MAWIRIAVAVAVYLVIAMLSSWYINRQGQDLKEMEGRGSTVVMVVGAVANIVVLAAVLLLVLLWDGRPLGSLGLGLSGRGAGFAALAVVLTFASAVIFLAGMQRSTDLEVESRSLPAGSAGRLLTIGAVLLAVAAQEEVLYRGYITLNLMAYGPAVVLVVSTLVFTAIHFLTNRVSPAQVAGWLLGGLVLGWVYLETGSIWVPVALHFAMDMTNVLVFGLAGELSMTRFSRPLTDINRAVYRVAFSVVIGAVLVGVYGLQLAPRWVG